MKVPAAIEAHGDNLLIVDRGANRVVIYEPTMYAQLIRGDCQVPEGDYDGPPSCEERYSSTTSVQIWPI